MEKNSQQNRENTTNSKEAHQLANPYILEWIRALDKLKKNGASDTSFSVIEKKEFLSGILVAQEKELEFLNEISKWHEEFSVAYIKMVDKRREALMISNKDLRKVLK